MTFKMPCSECDTELTLAESLIGKQIKCRNCGTMISVVAPMAKAKAKPAKAVAMVEEDEEDYEDQPTKKAKPKTAPAPAKSKTPLIAVGGIVAASVIGAGVYFGFLANKEPEVAKATTAPITQNTGVPADGEQLAKEVTAKTTEATTAKAPETKTEVATEPTKVATEVTATAAPKAVPASTPVSTPLANQGPGTTNSQDNEARLMNGQMDEITLNKCKRACVMIEVESKNGGGGTGSGWFGLEPNLIFTNAHVLDMKAPGSPPPAKITIYVNSGERGQTPGVQQRDIPNNHIKILGVDRENDLAVLQIIGEKDLPEPLKVRPSLALRETQRVQTFGFPLGYTPGTVSGGGKNQPSVSVRTSSIAGKRFDKDGVLRLVQIEGGVNQGNSGGPIIDAEGNIVAVTVSGLVDRNSGGLTTIVFGVATEHVFGLLNGRIDAIEYDQPYNNNGKVHVPVKMTVVDPLGRFKKAGFGYWIGDNATKTRPPGTSRTGILPSDKEFTQVDFKYDAAKKVATGELVFNNLPPGLAFWTQPFYSNTNTPIFWMPGTPLPMTGPPVDRVAASLKVNLRPGTTRPITLTKEFANNEFFEGEGESKEDRQLVKFSMKGTEKLLEPDRQDSVSAARLRIGFDDLDIKVSLQGGREFDAVPKNLMLILKKSINQIEAFGFINKQGELYKYVTNTLAADNAMIKAIAPQITGEVLGGLQVASIKLPNKDVQANETWTSSKNLVMQLGRISQARSSGGDDDGGSPQPPGGGRNQPAAKKPKEVKYSQEITYTYLGTRLKGGKREAVVKVEGKAVPAAGQSKDSVYGMIKGYAYIDVNSGVVTDADIENELELDTSERGFKKKLSIIEKIKITRGAQVN